MELTDRQARALRILWFHADAEIAPPENVEWALQCLEGVVTQVPGEVAL